METQPIPIAALKVGDFYDIQDSAQKVVPALLLAQLPNNLATLLFLNYSNVDEEMTILGTHMSLYARAMQIETTEIDVVYVYRTFSRLPVGTLKIPKSFPGEDLVDQISEVMCRVVIEDQWVLTFPHFCEGYLYIYLSYLRWRPKCPRREERCRLWFEFMNSFFTAINDHILKLKPILEANIDTFVSAVKDLDQLSERSWEIREDKEVQSSIQKEIKLQYIKNTAFNTIRSGEFASKSFNCMWNCMLRDHLDELLRLKLEDRLSFRNLLLNSPKSIATVSHQREIFKELVENGFPGLCPEEISEVKLRIVVAGLKGAAKSSFLQPYEHSFELAEDLLLNYDAFDLSLEKVCSTFLDVILGEKLLDLILITRRTRLEEFVMTRPETFPLIFAHIKGRPKAQISFYSFLQCLIARTALEDWEFLSFITTHQSAILYTDLHEVKMYIRVKELVSVALEHNMSAELLRDLFPCVNFGHLVFPALADGFTLTRRNKVMFTYFGSEEKCRDSARETMKRCVMPVGPQADREVSMHLKGQKLDLWYVFGGSVQIQLIWIRQFTAIKRLSISLTRELCGYLVYS